MKREERNERVVTIHKKEAESLDKNTMETVGDERYPTQGSEKEFKVILHFSEQSYPENDVVNEWIRILKDVYLKSKLEERKMQKREKENSQEKEEKIEEKIEEKKERGEMHR